jgi:hypothetical protein
MVVLREEYNEAEEVVKKEKEYMEYIEDHLANVRKAYQNLFVSRMDEIETDSISNEEMKEAIMSIEDDVSQHDASKMGDEEFPAYRTKYYPTKQEEDNMNADPVYKDHIENMCNKAWEHHFMNNNHHAKYWKVENNQFQKNNDPKEMTLGAIIHMICDWQAMSYHFKSNILDWYEKDADEEKGDLNYNTRKIVEEILYTVCER